MTAPLEAEVQRTGFYIEQLSGEKPSSFYIEEQSSVKNTTQENEAKKRTGFYIEQLSGEKPSSFYIEEQHILFSSRASLKEEKEKKQAV